MTRLDAGEGDDAVKGKRQRKGFKVDRFANYQQRRQRELGGDAKLSNKHNISVPAGQAKSVVFDEAARREFLLSFHKKKNERRVRAFVDMKRKVQRESNRVRREQREEARLAYNRFARVPILPDYTYRMPDGAAQDAEDTDEGDAGDSDEREGEGGLASDSEGTSGQVSTCALSQPARLHRCEWAARDRRLFETAVFATQRSEQNDSQRGLTTTSGLTCESSSVHAVAGTGGGGEREAKEGDAPAETVVVEVKPLFGMRRNTASSTAIPAASSRAGHGGKRPPAVLHGDFSDLPQDVVKELMRIKEASRGPSRTPSRLNMMRELEKIRKIRKHSRKGHGKKTARGKRKNR